MPDTDPLGW